MRNQSRRNHAMLTEVKQAVEKDDHGARGGVVINGIRCDPATAEHISGHPGGDANFYPSENFRRFDEHLYRTPQGYFFIMRPLDPEEAEAWIIAHGDEPLARQLFPAEDSD
jgi:hypothetical protein